MNGKARDWKKKQEREREREREEHVIFTFQVVLFSFEVRP